VDLFVSGVSQDFATLTQSVANANVDVFDLTSTATASGETPAPRAGRAIASRARHHRSLRPVITVARWLRLLRDTAKYRLRIDDLGFVLAPWVFERTERRMEGRTYKLFIGIEREGLIWAGEMARRRNVPSAYFSLELYTNDSPNVTGRRYKRLKRLESRYHRESQATIIQDSPRARLLLDDNRVPATTVHLVPVSLRGEARTEKSRYLHEKLGLKRDVRIILVLGQVHAKRYTHDAVAAAQEFPDNWILVVHGPAYGDAQLLACGLCAWMRRSSRWRFIIPPIRVTTTQSETACATPIRCRSRMRARPGLRRTSRDLDTGPTAIRARCEAELVAPLQIGYATTRRVPPRQRQTES
jgi:hypothetical protein